MNSVHFCSIFTARFARDTEGAEVIKYLFSGEGTENKYPSLQAKSSLITEPCLRLVGRTDISFSNSRVSLPITFSIILEKLKTKTFVGILRIDLIVGKAYKKNPDDITDSETWLQAEQWNVKAEAKSQKVRRSEGGMGKGEVVDRNLRDEN